MSYDNCLPFVIGLPIAFHLPFFLLSFAIYLPFTIGLSLEPPAGRQFNLVMCGDRIQITIPEYITGFYSLYFMANRRSWTMILCMGTELLQIPCSFTNDLECRLIK